MPPLILSPAKRLAKLYGDDFPSPKSDGWEDGEKWRVWLDARHSEQRATLQDRRLHYARHRNFRQGRQWISSRDGRVWREPKADTNTIRVVLNIIGPSLDFRLGLLEEQRPGFRHEPLPGAGIGGREAAEAQQSVVEHYYYLMKMWRILRAATGEAQTDGVSFLHVYVDPSKGPEKENVEAVAPDDPRYITLLAAGFAPNADGTVVVPLDENDKPLAVGVDPYTFREGDLATRIVLAHETFCDPEARTLNGPNDAARWFVLRRARDLKSARIETGRTDLESEVSDVRTDLLDERIPSDSTPFWQRGLPVFPSSRRRIDEATIEYAAYIAPSDEFPDGILRRVIGKHIVQSEDELPGRMIPFVEVRDGSSDENLYPRPVMSNWINKQVTINALVSLAVQHARLFGGGRLLSQKDSLIEETYTKIFGSVVEYRGIKPDVIQSQRVSGDVWQLISLLVKDLEDETGWNDLARGRVSGEGGMQDVSGRALLGARELFERTFGPMVRQTADAMTDWATLIVKTAAWLYGDSPRMIPIVGRPDLAKAISAEKLGDTPTVYVDPETLMPLPRALRNQLLFDLLQQGMITLEEYRRRAPFAEIRNAHLGDVDQWERAQWVNTRLEENWQNVVAQSEANPAAAFAPEAGLAVLYQDDPVVYKRALGEILFDERKPWPLRQLAATRWNVYDDLERAKAAAAAGAPAAVPPEVVGSPLPTALPPELGSSEAGLAQGMTAPSGAAPAPTMSPTVLPTASQQSAEPLGSVGAVEAGLER